MKRRLLIHSAIALAVSLIATVALREVLIKLADSTLVFVDADGFWELAAKHPLGWLDWGVRLLAATCLKPWGIGVLLALMALAMGLGALANRRHAIVAVWLPVVLVLAPLMLIEGDLWLVLKPQFIFYNLIWLIVISALMTAGKRAGTIALAAIILAIPALARLAWGDLAPHIAMLEASGLRAAIVWRAFDIPAAICLLLPVALKWLPKPIRFEDYAMPAAMAVIAVIYLTSIRHLTDQLEMERLVRAGKFADVLKVATDKARPERMETAWRILAMFRTDRLDRDLNKYPITVSHLDSDEEEMIMEGPMLLCEYGLVLPARRWIYDSAMTKGWRPDYYRLLGNCAIACGEYALAERNHAEFERCPFRRELKVRERNFEALRELAAMWNGAMATAKIPYFGGECMVERFVYSLFGSLQDCPIIALKMTFAVALLEGRREMLRDNTHALSKIYPNGKIGPVFLEALK